MIKAPRTATVELVPVHIALWHSRRNCYLHHEHIAQHLHQIDHHVFRSWQFNKLWLSNTQNFVEGMSTHRTNLRRLSSFGFIMNTATSMLTPWKIVNLCRFMTFIGPTSVWQFAMQTWMNSSISTFEYLSNSWLVRAIKFLDVLVRTLQPQQRTTQMSNRSMLIRTGKIPVWSFQITNWL